MVKKERGPKAETDTAPLQHHDHTATLTASDSVAGRKRKASSPIVTSRNKRRSPPPSIKITRAEPIATAKHGNGNHEDVDGENEDETSTPRRYITRSKRLLQKQIGGTPTSSVPASLTPTTNQKQTKLPVRIVKPPFRLLDSIIRHPEIILRLASLMEPSSLTTLYAISKPLHFIINSHFTTYIRSSAQIHAPDSSYIFPWRCYRRLTIKDPGHRLNDSSRVRDVPSLLWLQMVTDRHRCVEDILAAMKKQGHEFVGKWADSVKALKKLWFLMDLPRNGVRIATVHNENYWFDQDLFMATFFLVKLDMRLTDPVEGTGETGLRKLMMGQRSLFPLRNLLQGRLDTLQLLKLYVCYDFHPRMENQHLPCLGIPPEAIGRACVESWGLGQQRLLRPDELVLRENIRRSMNLHMRYMEMIRWGHKMQSNSLGEPKKERLTIGESTKRLDWAVGRMKDVYQVQYDRDVARMQKKGAEARETLTVQGIGEKVALRPKTKSAWSLGQK